MIGACYILALLIGDRDTVSTVARLVINYSIGNVANSRAVFELDNVSLDQRIERAFIDGSIRRLKIGIIKHLGCRGRMHDDRSRRYGENSTLLLYLVVACNIRKILVKYNKVAKSVIFLTRKRQRRRLHIDLGRICKCVSLEQTSADMFKLGKRMLLAVIQPFLARRFYSERSRVERQQSELVAYRVVRCHILAVGSSRHASLGLVERVCRSACGLSSRNTLNEARLRELITQLVSLEKLHKCRVVYLVSGVSLAVVFDRERHSVDRQGLLRYGKLTCL